MGRGTGELKANQVLQLEDGREFLVAIVQRDGDNVQVTGMAPGGIGCAWVKRDQLRRATREDYEKAGDQGEAAGDDAGDQQDGAGERPGTDDAGDTGDAQA